MTKLLFVLAVGSLAACGGKKGSNEAFEKTSAFADAMCACKDADCAKKVMDDMTKWSTEWAKNAKPDQVPDAEEQKKFTEVSKKLTDCSTKAMTPK
jgi:hypothetical protein